MQELEPWLARIRAGNSAFRKEIGSAKLGLFGVVSQLLASPRVFGKAISGALEVHAPTDLQQPWLPRWPALAARPFDDSRHHTWTGHLRDARDDIRNELAQVKDAFARAR